ncbi:MAG TPA: aminoglycoside phosphotransferase family protein [Acidimicrobiales bacterium]|jgi:streptomycin 6-kinase|nr:aminoglycoside phosphotransferase family protein [Acidimicrobiales bacterium]
MQQLARAVRTLLDADPTTFAGLTTPEGRAWIGRLGQLFDDAAAHWGLAADDGPILHGYSAVVVPARRGATRVAVKLVCPPHAVDDEAAGLSAWAGVGTARLLDVDHFRGILLEERLDASRPLSAKPLGDAARAAGALIATLAVKSEAAMPTTYAHAAAIAATLDGERSSATCPLPAAVLEAALQAARQLGAGARRSLVHADLHYDNILASYRPGSPWIAIDPKPLIGDPERSVAELLWTRADEMEDDDAIRTVFDAVVAGGGLDEVVARRWTIARTAEYWLWGSRRGLTEDPRRCERVIRAMVRDPVHR